jgi:hypothetical protein
MSDTYTLTFINKSNNNWDFCCYQQDPDINAPDVMSLAWFAFPVAPTTSVSFSWEINYQFVWMQVGKLAAGVKFAASQKWDADLTNINSVDFTRKGNKAFTFQNQMSGSVPGTLFINQDETVPSDTAAVGINMGIKDSPGGAGSGTFVVAAQPDITASFTPHPTYWVTFGQYTPGQVLDMKLITKKHQIIFPPNVFEMVAVLGPDNKWKVTTMQALNQAFLASGDKYAHALLLDYDLIK